VGIGGVLNVQNNLNVTGNIGYTGDVTLIIPVVYTLEPFNITGNSAMVTGEIFSNGGAAVIASGVVWSTSSGPTVALATRTTDGTSQGTWVSTITGLTENTTYYVRAYATNVNGTGYGEEIMFTTPAQGTTILDFDGNIYNTLVIGTQTWLAQNLKTTHLNDGTAIANVTDPIDWSMLGTPGYAWYSNDPSGNADYGILYNWNTVNTGLLCPTGWHVPTDIEWNTLITFAGGGTVAGGKLKETGLSHWLSPNTGATDEYGFTALPGGIREYMGMFMDLGTSGSWWTSSMVSVDPFAVRMNTFSAEIFIMQMMGGSGMSVRCIKD